MSLNPQILPKSLIILRLGIEKVACSFVLYKDEILEIDA